MKVAMEEARTEIGRIEHASCQAGMARHWKAVKDEEDNEIATVQSICWLFCWAKTGQNSNRARIQAKLAFDTIFDRPFDWLCKRLDHDLARKWRYSTDDVNKIFFAHIGAEDSRTASAD